MRDSQKLNVQEVAEIIGTGAQALNALVTAERTGRATVNGMSVWHEGYASGSVEFNAATSLFSIHTPH